MSWYETDVSLKQGHQGSLLKSPLTEVWAGLRELRGDGAIPRVCNSGIVNTLSGEKSGSRNPEGEGMWKASFGKHSPAGRELRKLDQDLSLLLQGPPPIGQVQQEAEYREPIREIHTGHPLGPEQGGKTWQGSSRGKWRSGSKVISAQLSRNLARAAGKHPTLDDP